MKIGEVCREYLNGFAEVYHCRENTLEQTALAVLKIFSYCTLLLPALAGAALFFCDRISSNYSSTTSDKVARIVLLNSGFTQSSIRNLICYSKEDCQYLVTENGLLQWVNENYGDFDAFYTKMHESKNPYVSDAYCMWSHTAPSVSIRMMKEDPEAVKYLLMDSKEAGSLTVGKLENASAKQLKAALGSVLSIDKTKEDMITEDIQAVPLSAFHRISMDLVNAKRNEMNPLFFSLLSGKQLEKLNLKDVSLEFVQGVFDLKNIKYAKERFSHLSLDQVNSILDKLAELDLLWLIPNDKLSKLDLSKVPEGKLKGLFVDSYKIGYDKESKTRFACLSSTQVNSILGKLANLNLLWLIPNDKLSVLDLSKVPEKKLSGMFVDSYKIGYDRDSKARFAYLSSIQVNSILGKLANLDLLWLIPNDKLSGLDLSQVPEKKLRGLFVDSYQIGYDTDSKARFACLSSVQVNSILGKLAELDLLWLIPNDKLSGLDLSQVPEKKLRGLFVDSYQIGYDTDSKARFACLSSVQVNSILGKLAELDLLWLIPNDKLSGLDLSKVPEGKLKGLFVDSYKIGYDTDSKARFAYLSSIQVNSILGKLAKLDLLWLLSSGQIVSLELSKIPKDLLGRIFRKGY